jgi:hypothetical protein
MVAQPPQVSLLSAAPDHQKVSLGLLGCGADRMGNLTGHNRDSGMRALTLLQPGDLLAGGVFELGFPVWNRGALLPRPPPEASHGQS